MIPKSGYRFSDKIMRNRGTAAERQPFQREEHGVCSVVARPAGRRPPGCRRIDRRRAQNVADFYKGKSVDVYIGYSVGGGYDLYARLLARHIGKHIPGNPTVVPKNMEGAGSLRLANWLYNGGAQGWHGFGTIGRGTGFDPLLGSKAAQFDATKFTWIGSANDEVSVCVA